MVQIRAPLDVPHVEPRNEYRPTETAPNPEFNAIFQVSERVREIVDRAREQEIDNDVRRGELNLRTRLDGLRRSVEQDPDYASMPERWGEAARQIDTEISDEMSSPMHQRLWRDRAERVLSEEGRYINGRTYERAVEQARAGLITNIGALRRSAIDPNASPETRATAIQGIERELANAALRRVLTTDQAAQELEQARNAQAEFDREQGMRQRAQTEEDRIWAEAGGDYATAIGLVRQIQDPALRDMVEDRVSVRHQRDEAGAAETLESAMERAYGLVENGETLEGLSAGDRRVIIAAGNMDDLRTYARSRSTPGGTEAFNRTSTAYRDVIFSAAADRERSSVLASVNLNQPLMGREAQVLGVAEGTSLRAVMTPGDFNEVEARQRELRGEPSADGSPNDLINNTFNNRLLPRARQLAAMASVNVQPNNGNSDDAQETRTRRAAFEGYLYGELRAHIQTFNAPPNDAEIDAIARSALTRSAGGGTFGMGRTTRYRFEASPTAPVNVPYENILPAQRERLIRAWIRAGNTEDPSPDQIARMYSEEIAGQAYDGN